MKYTLPDVLERCRAALQALNPGALVQAGEAWADARLGFFFPTLDQSLLWAWARDVLHDLRTGDGLTPNARAEQQLYRSITLGITVREGAHYIFEAYAAGSITVTYLCQRHRHPYYPPPEWYDGKKCWCGSEILRED